MINRTTPAAAVLLAITASVSAASDPAISVVTSQNFFVPSGPLVLPPSTNQVGGYIGNPRIDNDGNWYGAFSFFLNDATRPIEFGRDVALFRNGVPFNREGYALPNSPSWTPQPPIGLRTVGLPYDDAQIASDGSIAQVMDALTGFSTLPDGTPDPGMSILPFPTIDSVNIATIDNRVFLIQGTTEPPFDTLFQLPAGPLAEIGDISTVEPLSATEVIVAARIEQEPGNTFGDSLIAYFRTTDPGLPTQSNELLFTAQNGDIVPDINLALSSVNTSEAGFDANSSGSFITTVDISGAPFDSDDAVLFYDGPSETFSLLARAEPPNTGSEFQILFNAPVAINEAGDWAFVADDSGPSSSDDFIVVNGQEIIREGAIVGTLQPSTLQLGLPTVNIELDREGNVIWPAFWSVDNLCTGQTTNGSDFGIFQGIFFNDQPILEAGVTELHNVDVGGTVFPTLVVKEILNNEFGGFSVSPDGDRLIAAVFAIEPSDNICDFSDNNDAVPGAFVLVEVDLTLIRDEPCPGDANRDDAVTALDISIVLGNFGSTGVSGPSEGDLDGDGNVTALDISVVLGAFGTTCP